MKSLDESRRMQRASGKRRWPALVVLCAGLGLWLASYSSRAFERNAPATATVNTVAQDYGKFLHTSDSHSKLNCASCHNRTDNSATPRFPGHKSCMDCHQAQFLTPQIPMCNICHSSLSGGNPPLRGFPTRFKESFNVKFDHAQHSSGEAAASCASCHTASLRRGVAMTIPAGIAAHNSCYQCHSPGKTFGGRDISSCATCHQTGGYRRTSTNSTAFNTGFSHAKHGPRQRLNCADCHSLRAGLPQGRQVTSPRAAQHFSAGNTRSCASCHNNRRAFGEADFDDCKRCHTGATFRN